MGSMTIRQLELVALALVAGLVIVLARGLLHITVPWPFLIGAGYLLWLGHKRGWLTPPRIVQDARLGLRRRYDRGQAVVDVLALRLADPDEAWLVERRKSDWQLISDDAVVRITGDRLAVTLAGVAVPLDTVQTTQLGDAVLARLEADDTDALHGAVKAYRQRRMGRRPDGG